MPAMSATSFSHGQADPAGSWPLAVFGGGPVAAPARHMLDLARFFPVDGLQWPDVLVAATRRHLAGCFNTLETEMRGALEQHLGGAAPSSVPAPILWTLVQYRPHVVSPALLAHMRLRGAVGLLVRNAAPAQGDRLAPVADQADWLVNDADPAVAEAAADLALAEERWAAVAGEDSPLRADLPADHYADLVWTAAALLGDAFHRAGAGSEEAYNAVTKVALDLLSVHDEGSGAIARAALLARLLRGRPDEELLLGQALGRRRYLLFAALAAERVAVHPEAILQALIDGSIDNVAALTYALGGSSSDFRHLLVQLRPVRSGLDDLRIVAHADRYDQLTERDIAAAFATLRQPVDLRSKLAMIAS